MDVFLFDVTTPVSEFHKYYGREAQIQCQNTQGNFKYKWKALLGRFSQSQKNTQKGIQTWKDAQALLRGEDPHIHKKEAELLAQELARQGV